MGSRRWQFVVCYEVIGHHLPKLFTEHLRRDTRYRPTKLPKAPQPFEKPLKYHRLPSVLQSRLSPRRVGKARALYNAFCPRSFFGLQRAPRTWVTSHAPQ
jgi:hypothetical protein